MRKMKKDGVEVTIREHIITKGFWEFYITTRYSESSGIQEAVVVGHEVELGDVDINEVNDLIMLVTEQLQSVMPAPGWEWVD